MGGDAPYSRGASEGSASVRAPMNSPRSLGLVLALASFHSMAGPALDGSEATQSARAALAQLPGLAAFAGQSLVEEGNAVRLTIEGAAAPQVYLLRGPNNSWHAVVMPGASNMQLSAASVWPQFGAQVFGDGVLMPQAVIVSTADAELDARNWPAAVKSSLSAFGTDAVPVKKGGNAFLKVRIGSSGPLSQVSKAIGFSNGEVPVRGTMGAELVNKLTGSAAGGSGPTSYSLTVDFPDSTPAVFAQTGAAFSVSFPSTSVKLEGQGSAFTLTGTQKVNLSVMNTRLALDNTLSFQKSDTTYTVACLGSVNAPNDDLFATKSLGLGVTTVTLGGELSVAKPRQGKASVEGFGLTVGVLFANQGLQGDVGVTVTGGKVTELALSVKGNSGAVKLTSFEPFKSLPGAGEFAFSEVAVGVNPADRNGYLFGEMAWRGVATRAAVMAGKSNGRNVLALFLKASGLKLSKLNAALAAGDVVPLDNVVMIVSKDTLTGVSKSELPSRVRGMLDEVTGAADSKFTIHDGLTVVTSFAPSGDSGKPMQALGLGATPMVIAGNIGGIFNGDPSVGFYADLGTFAFPGNMSPGFLKLQSVTPKFFIVARDLRSAPAVDLGVELAVGVQLGPDELELALKAYGTLGAAGASINGKATMAGTWNNPLGLENMSIANTTLGFGLDANPSASVSMAVGGTMSFDQRSFTLAGTLGLATAAPFPGTPTKLGLAFAGTEMSPVTQLKIMDTFVRSAVSPRRGSLAGAIPDQGLKDTLALLVKQPSLVDYAAGKGVPLELIRFTNVKGFMATPGATDPDLPGILGMGLGVKGTLELDKKAYAGVDSYVTASDGLQLKGNLGDFNFGNLLALKGAKVDVAVPMPPSGIPHFKINGWTKFLAYEGKLDLELSKDRAKLVCENDWGRFGKANIRAETLGESLFKPSDFVLEMEASADMKNGLRRELAPALTAAGKASQAEANDALNRARGELSKLKNTLENERRNASRGQQSAADAVNRAREEVVRAKRVVSDTDNDISSKKSAIRKADRDVNVVNAARFRIEIGYLYTKLEGARTGLAIAERTLAGVRRVTAAVPVELLPAVAVARAAVEAKETEIDSLEASVAAAGEIDKLGQTISQAAGLIPLTVDEMSFRNGRLSDAINGKPQLVTVKLTLTLDPKNPLVINEKLEVNLMYPARTNLADLADSVLGVVRGRRTLEKAVARDAANAASRPQGLLTATASSRQSSEFSGGDALRAIDGNRDGDWRNNSVTHTNNGPNEWLEYDLGIDAFVSGVAVFSRTDCCSDRLNGARIELSLDPCDQNPRRVLADQEVRPAQQVPFNVATPVRYVCVRHVNKSEYLSVAEVEVSGKPAVIPSMIAPGRKVALYNRATKRFLRMNDKGGIDSSGSPSPNLPSGWAWERFQVFDGGNGLIALRSLEHGRFMRITDRGVADSGGPSDTLPDNWPWERFRVVDLGTGRVGLYSGVHRRFLKVFPNGVVDGSTQRELPQLPPDWELEMWDLIPIE